MRKCLDTESVGFFGGTILIQTGEVTSSGLSVNLHNIFTSPVNQTLDLIESLAEDEIVAYNISHDSFHINRTYNVLKQLSSDKPPDLYEYMECESSLLSKVYCWNPKSVVDLMIYGKRGELQQVLKQKPVKLKKIPREMAEKLIPYLNINLPPIMQQRWKIFSLHEDGSQVTPEQMAKRREGKLDFSIDPDFVNLVLDFRPSRSLKSVAKYILGFTDTEDFHGTKPKDECAWKPDAHEWVDIFYEHLHSWSIPQKQIYAKNDIIYLHKLDEYFSFPEPDIDSRLACLAGATHWSGYGIDVERCSLLNKELEAQVTENRKIINYNSPRQIVNYLQEVCSDFEKIAIQNSKKETLKCLIEQEINPELSNRSEFILSARNTEMEYRLTSRLNEQKRLHVTFNVSGTRTNRQAGGDAINKSSSINPQGIKKGKIREIFTLTDVITPILSGGDFSGCEVVIATKVWGCKKLLEQLQTGKKIHAIWGSYLYGMTYDEVLATDGIGAKEPDGYYARSKNSFFASLYGAQEEKISQVTGLEVEQVKKAYTLFHKDYPEVKETQDKIAKMFTVIHNFSFKSEHNYIDNMFSFRRYFTTELEIIKHLIKLANDMPEELVLIGDQLSVVRRTKRQNGRSAVQSAILAVCKQLESSMIRVANNFVIQSVGGELTKFLQHRISELQPKGIHRWVVKCFNIHDELQISHIDYYTETIESIVKEFLDEYSVRLPLLAMEWEKRKPSWHKPKTKKK